MDDFADLLDALREARLAPAIDAAIDGNRRWIDFSPGGFALVSATGERVKSVPCIVLAMVVAAVACGNVTGESDGSTTGPVACEGALVRCADDCIDLAGDESNCGACGEKCGVSETCVRGGCQRVSCPDGETNCDGICVDLSSNPLSCGACNRACGPDAECSGGACVCRESTERCAGSCANFDTSIQHCGRCGNPCLPGQMCVDGKCVGCGPPSALCGDQCVDLSSDIEACGSCGTSCETPEVCIDGSCRCPVDGSFAQCGDRCADLETDGDHCGACGNACSAATRCSSGTCLPCHDSFTGLSEDFFFCPSSSGDPLEICLAQARTAAPPPPTDAAPPPLEPDLECQCRACLLPLLDCVSDAGCIRAWECALRNACTVPCWDSFGVCAIGSGGCFKFCPPSSGSVQTAARVEALFNCTRDAGCGI